MAKLILENFSYFGGETFNLSLNECKTICLSGASGSGKSLFLKALADLIEHQGNMLLDDTPYQQITPVKWRQSVGLLPAESQWWYEKVAMHFKNRNEASLTALGLPTEAYDWDIARCSTGEKQRLALIRLLENQPDVLLLDEPTASLDAKSIVRVEQLIKNYVEEKNASVIWVSHDNDQIQRVADRKFVVSNYCLTEVAL